MTPRRRSSDAADASPLVPADYLIKPGDEILLTLWGSVDADLRLVVDRSGRISIPRVGPMLVAGVAMPTCRPSSASAWPRCSATSS